MDSSIVHLWANYRKKKCEEPWSKWLNEYVFLDFRDDSSSLKRYQSFQLFCDKGLLPFLQSHKYTIHAEYDLPNELANFLFKEKRKGDDEFVRTQPFYRDQSNRLKMDVDYDYYITRGISDEDWESFWSKWKWMTDFYDEKFRNRYLIPKFVYARLNLELSEATEIISREIEDEESADDYMAPVEQASDAIGQGRDRNSLY